MSAFICKGAVMIRVAQKEDCINLAVLSSQVWLETYAVEGIRTECTKYVTETFTESYFLDRLNNPNYRLLISVTVGRLQGFVLVNLASRFEGELNGYEIEKLYVHRDFQGQGLGRKFIFEVGLRFGKSFWLYTWVKNESNAFYKHLGFKHTGQLNFEFENTLIENNVFTYNRT